MGAVSGLLRVFFESPGVGDLGAILEALGGVLGGSLEYFAIHLGRFLEELKRDLGSILEAIVSKYEKHSKTQ